MFRVKREWSIERLNNITFAKFAHLSKRKQFEVKDQLLNGIWRIGNKIIGQIK